MLYVFPVIDMGDVNEIEPANVVHELMIRVATFERMANKVQLLTRRQFSQT
jgi:hypothetical protein